jgi:hypothetical protein
MAGDVRRELLLLPELGNLAVLGDGLVTVKGQTGGSSFDSTTGVSADDPKTAPVWLDFTGLSGHEASQFSITGRRGPDGGEVWRTTEPHVEWVTFPRSDDRFVAYVANLWNEKDGFGSQVAIVLDVATGAELWRRELRRSGEHWSPLTSPEPLLTLENGTLYLERAWQSGHSRQIVVEALEPATGIERWRADLGFGELTVRPMEADGVTAFMFHNTNEDRTKFVANTIVVVDAETGDELWEHAQKQDSARVEALTHRALWFAHGRLYITRGDAIRGSLQSVDPHDGAVRWMHDFSGNPSLAAGEATTFIATGSEVVAYDELANALLWRTPIGGAQHDRPLATMAHDVVYVAIPGIPSVRYHD